MKCSEVMRVNGITPQNVRDLWINNMRNFPRKTCVVWQGVEYSFAQVDDATDRICAGLQRRFGMKREDRVAICSPNCLEFFLLYWGIVKGGGVVVPINTRLTHEDMRYMLENIDPLVFCIHSSVRDVASKALSTAKCSPKLVTIGFDEPDGVSFDELLKEERLPEYRDIDPEQLVIIMHTSGTTGRPKGAMVTHSNILFNIRMAIIAHSWRHEDVHLLVVPMFHATALYSMLPGSAYLGSTIVIAPRPDIPEVVRLIEQHRCTTFFGVPTLFYFLTTYRGLKEHDLTSLRLIAYAGAPMPPQTIRKLRELFPWVWLHNFFGLTETISMTHVLPNKDALTHPESIGKVLPEVAQRIIDEHGNDVRMGEVGELCFHKRNVVKGYWNQPELMREAMIGDWFRTGDLACIDEDGYVYLKGRKKDMIIVAGENVYALEVENAILSHDGVMDVAVVGVPAKGALSYLGELIKAVVVPKPGVKLTESEIKRHCSTILPSYKVPHIVEFREQLPRNPAGKVIKRELV